MCVCVCEIPSKSHMAKHEMKARGECVRKSECVCVCVCVCVYVYVCASSKSLLTTREREIERERERECVCVCVSVCVGGYLLHPAQISHIHHIGKHEMKAR